MVRNFSTFISPDTTIKTMNENLIDRLQAAIRLNSEIEKIFLSDLDIEGKRLALREYLGNLLAAISDNVDAIRPMEWILCRDAVWVFRSILNPRSEELSEFSVLSYIDALINSPNSEDGAELSIGFVTEIEHLIKGVCGLADIYSEEPPSFLSIEGREAALDRSDYLSNMARTSCEHME